MGINGGKDEDDLLDQKRDDAHRNIEQGRPSGLDCSDDDKDFIEFADEQQGESKEIISDDDGGEDDEEDENGGDVNDDPEAVLADMRATWDQQERNIKAWERDRS